MWRNRIIVICILPVISVIVTYHFARADDTCDFYDRYGMYVLAFDKNIKLGRSGASITSGISFVFSDNSTLKIIPEIATYDPKFSEPGEENAIPDDIRFVNRYTKDDCKIFNAVMLKGITISCDNYEYSIFEINDRPVKTYITVYYDFVGLESRAQYEKILQSLVTLPQNLKRDFENIINDEIGEYYFLQDGEYQKRVDEYEQPDIACDKYRFRDKLLLLIHGDAEKKESMLSAPVGTAPKTPASTENFGTDKGQEPKK